MHSITYCNPEIELLGFLDAPVLPATSICHDLPADDDSRVNRVLDKLGHTAILRHGFASIRITGISRVIGRQILRKAHADYLEMSQRYVDASDCRFVLPKKIAEDPTLKESAEEGIIASLNTYKKLRELGATKEDARYNLVPSAETKIIMSGNLQMWWDFFILRLGKSVQPECYDVAIKIFKLLASKTDIFDVHPKIDLIK